LAALALVSCNRGTQTKEAVQQGVIEYLSNRSNLNISSMDVRVTSVSFTQNEADAVVSFSPKGGDPAQSMTMRYTLHRSGGKWVVKNKSDMGESPHGAGPGAGDGQVPPGHPPLGGERNP